MVRDKLTDRLTLLPIELLLQIAAKNDKYQGSTLDDKQTNRVYRYPVYDGTRLKDLL